MTTRADNAVQLALGQLVIDYYLTSVREQPQAEAVLQSQARMLDAVRVNFLRGATTLAEAEAWLDAGRTTLAQQRSLRVGDTIRAAIDKLAQQAGKPRTFHSHDPRAEQD